MFFPFFFFAVQLREWFLFLERGVCEKPLMLSAVNVCVIGYLMNPINPLS